LGRAELQQAGGLNGRSFEPAYPVLSLRGGFLPAHFPLNYPSVHAAIMAHGGTDKKPTVGF